MPSRPEAKARASLPHHEGSKSEAGPFVRLAGFCSSGSMVMISKFPVRSDWKAMRPPGTGVGVGVGTDVGVGVGVGVSVEIGVGVGIGVSADPRTAAGPPATVADGVGEGSCVGVGNAVAVGSTGRLAVAGGLAELNRGDRFGEGGGVSASPGAPSGPVGVRTTSPMAAGSMVRANRLRLETWAVTVELDGLAMVSKTPQVHCCSR